MRERAAPLAIALLFVAALAGARVAMSADSAHVWLLGRLFGSACAFRTHFGIPCPNCGMSRSVILTMHGDVGEAVMLNPAGPLLVGGVVAAAILLGFTAFRRGKAPARRWMLPALLGYSGLYVSVLIGHWLITVL